MCAEPVPWEVCGKSCAAEPDLCARHWPSSSAHCFWSFVDFLVIGELFLKLFCVAILCLLLPGFRKKTGLL